MTNPARRRLRSRRVPLSAVFTSLTAVAAVTITGCSSDSDRDMYCADEYRVILPEHECDGDDDDDYSSSGSYGGHSSGHSSFIYIGSYGRDLRVNQRLPYKAGEQKISSTDQAARSRAGIPSRGGFGSHSGSGSS